MDWLEKNRYVETPNVEIVDCGSEIGKQIIIHSYINAHGKMVLNKLEATMLYLELKKFLESK